MVGVVVVAVMVMRVEARGREGWVRIRCIPFSFRARDLTSDFFGKFSPVISVSLKWEKIIGVHSMGAVNAFLAVPVEGREKF